MSAVRMELCGSYLEVVGCIETCFCDFEAQGLPVLCVEWRCKPGYGWGSRRCLHGVGLLTSCVIDEIGLSSLPGSAL